MKYNKLGSSDLEVSEVCLGSMTWGEQNTQADADQQIDYALDQGVNFIDTAEMYAVPPRAETCGATESIIGDWLSRNASKRQDIILATKVAGPGMSWVRGGEPLTGKSVKLAIEGSLKRLQTDYVDLYQLHWTNRTSAHFGRHWIGDITFSDLNIALERERLHEILDALGDCVRDGKVKYCGLSDDSTWGINEYLRLSDKHALPRMVSIQNEFNLLHTKDWPYLIENCMHENIAYLPWSPLATGILTGKYANGNVPEGSRWSMAQRNGLFRNTPAVHEAVAALDVVAKKYKFSLATLALAWCKRVDGVTSTIIGATSLDQLKENIEAFSVEFTDEMFQTTCALMKAHPNPF